ncbi:hypothetical protein AB0F17_58645 [Nonomuraea sp. NPDC026600]|uniref:hypothetical protein n=1 Tax=Nonomuraea sp. NPDC026600 TaxID=3155363 RepID=UPI0033E47F73
MNPCRYSNGTARCGATPTRFYQGDRCASHTPAALTGQPEPSGQYCAPKRCYCGNCPWWTPYNPYPVTSDSWVTDARAIASGKRRSSPEMYAAAKAEVSEQKERKERLRARAP